MNQPLNRRNSREWKPSSGGNMLQQVPRVSALHEDMNELKVAVRVGQAVDAASRVFCLLGPCWPESIWKDFESVSELSFLFWYSWIFMVSHGRHSTLTINRKFCVFHVFFEPRSQVWRAGRSKSPASRREQHRCYSISRMSQSANRFHTFAVTICHDMSWCSKLDLALLTMSLWQLVDFQNLSNYNQDRAELATEEYLPVTPGTILEARWHAHILWIQNKFRTNSYQFIFHIFSLSHVFSLHSLLEPSPGLCHPQKESKLQACDWCSLMGQLSLSFRSTRMSILFLLFKFECSIVFWSCLILSGELQMPLLNRPSH